MKQAKTDLVLTTALVARRLGVTPASVRIWTRQGKLAAELTASGIRLFREADVRRLEIERGLRVA